MSGQAVLLAVTLQKKFSHMRKNIIQHGSKSADGRNYIEYDWFDGGIPANVILSEKVYIDSSYGFDSFHSTLPVAMTMGKGSGCYDRATFILGKQGKIEIGEFNIMNGSVFICNKMIRVGSHCMFAWGSVITDNWMNGDFPKPVRRRTMLIAAAKDKLRPIPCCNKPKSVNIEDNVWVGFDAVVLSGVKLGRGSIIGSKSVITADVPPYTIVAGNPAKIIRYLQPDDSPEVIAAIMKELLI
jgi:acetyltransferase-like isoleucine patch superfamily enzyme